MFSTVINGTQIDIQAAIVYDTTIGLQTSYQHVYEVRNNIVGDDQNDIFNKNNVSNPCFSNPCKNNGSCISGFGGAFVCICLKYNTGTISLH